jgi:two-component system nitrogen regulation response regulator GlnG
MEDLKLLIVDDDESVLTVLGRFLKDKGLKVGAARDGKDALGRLSSGGYPIALVDVNLPGKNGLELLKELRETGVDAEVIIMTAEQTLDNTVEAMKRGAFDYIAKPFDLTELEIIVDRAIQNVKLKRELGELKDRLKEKSAASAAFVGKSKKIQAVFKTVGKVAERDVTVLISGESGTGKELLARLLHAKSLRHDGPFVAVNTAAVPRELMESELFGHEKGSFTGATEQRKGKFEIADRGTIFLDEIGDTTPELQSRLLRAIQEREFYRVGGKDPVRVDVRILTATNQDLEKAVEEGRFREDLFYRLNVVHIELPPLRERPGDALLLADHFLEKFADEAGIARKTLSKEAEERLDRYQWPGNVRELENTLRRAVLLSPNVQISGADLMLPEKRRQRKDLEELITERLTEFLEKTHLTGKQELYDTIMPLMEKPLLTLVLRKTGLNQVKASELLGINRNTLRKRIKDLKINLTKLEAHE